MRFARSLVFTVFASSIVALATIHCGSSSPTTATTSVDAGDAGASQTSDATANDASSALDTGADVVDAAPLPPSCGTASVTCTTNQAVASKITLPTSGGSFAVDLDGDGTLDNSFGNILGELASQGLNSQPAEDSLVASGATIILADEASVDPTLTTDPGSALVHVLAGNAQTTPDFSGAGTFTADTTQMPATYNGAINVGLFKSPPAPTVTKAFPINFAVAFGASTVTMPLYVAHVEITNTAGKPASVQINGAFKESDFQTTFIPLIASTLTADIAADPTSQQATTIEQLFDGGNCKNPDGSSATANDGIISPCEVSGNALVGNLFAPDVQLFDATGNYKPVPNGTKKDSISAAFSLTLVGATF